MSALIAVAVVSAPLSGARGAAPADPDGTVHIPAMDVPFSALASPEARRAFIRSRAQSVDPGVDIAAVRAATVAALAPLIARSAALYPVKIEAQWLGGVRTEVITPKGGVPTRNRRRVLINLHGGGFFVGARDGGRLEAIPMAGLGGFEVVAVDYRQGPESRFPAASEDVAAVYRALLRRYPAKNIGIYGSSAGGLLTAEALAWLQKEGLPAPGAVAIISASAGGWAGGDSSYFIPSRPVKETPHSAVSNTAYFQDASLDDPLAAPIVEPKVLAKFPPTLVITGTRDVSMSAAIHTHAELIRLGVEAELHVWEGVGHAFLQDPDLPESRQADQVMVSFFDRRLGRD
jgi:monoterpene epsilon-lactone hydrolase